MQIKEENYSWTQKTIIISIIAALLTDFLIR